ncbi:uncharacterized protein TNCV_4863321 [Trichonephila clavipes]|nr:uncharacterized protein TNCV_4863321 [Trichonephila clavipes]
MRICNQWMQWGLTDQRLLLHQPCHIPILDDIHIVTIGHPMYHSISFAAHWNVCKASIALPLSQSHRPLRLLWMVELESEDTAEEVYLTVPLCIAILVQHLVLQFEVGIGFPSSTTWYLLPIRGLFRCLSLRFWRPRTRTRRYPEHTADQLCQFVKVASSAIPHQEIQNLFLSLSSSGWCTTGQSLCKHNAVTYNATVQQPLTTVSRNSNPNTLMLKSKTGFVSKHNVVPFRCPYLTLIAIACSFQSRGLGSNAGEDMDVCKCIMPACHGGTLNRRRAASPLVRGGIEPNRTLTCMVLKATANDRRHLALCHDESRGPRSGLCRSGGLTTTTEFFRLSSFSYCFARNS